MTVNVSQIFVRYPSAVDAAGLCPDDTYVLQSGTPWLAVCSKTDETSHELAGRLSRALEADVLWFGLAGSALTSRFMKFRLGKKLEEHLDPPDWLEPSELPAYADVELALHKRIRSEGVPREYVFLYAAEIGMQEGPADAALVKGGAVETFRQRVPSRSKDLPRVLFDEFVEGERRVTENLRLKGSYAAPKAERLLAMLSEMIRRRALPEGWSVRIRLEGPAAPEIVKLARGLKPPLPFEIE